MLAIAARDIAKSYGARAVFTGVSLEVSGTGRLGIVGANGTGKSTLLRVLAGEPPDSGRVTRHPRVRITLLPQDLDRLDGTTWNRALDAVQHVVDLRRRWTALADTIAASPDDTAVLHEYGAAQDLLERLGGFQIEATVREVLSGVGLPPATWERPLSVLSGGERTRLNLARTLLTHPDVLLLDEPTNHLDIGALEWLEGFLLRFPGAVVVASHDRRFLDGVVERVIELDGGAARAYTGNYTAYASAKAAERAAQITAFEQHRAEVDRLREFVRLRLQRASKIAGGPKRGRDHYGRVARKVARGANAARTRLARLETHTPQAPAQADEIRVEFPDAERPGEALAHLRGVTIRYGDHRVLADVNLTLERGARVGLTGANASGKTSVLRLLAQVTVPWAGEVWVGPGARAGYLPQDPDAPDTRRRVIDVALDAGLPPAQARAVLAALLFRGDRVFQALATLSGGERTRLAVFELISRRVNLLLLDEPTNHLDLPSRERLEEALEAYAGTFVIATHDRYLLQRLCTSVWSIDDGSIRVRPAISPGRSGS